MICPEALGGKAAPLQNPSFVEFKKDMEADGITVVDLTDDFSALRRSGVEPFLKTDTHWTIEGMKLAARRIAAAIMERPQEPRPVRTAEVTGLGDIAAMLKLADARRFFPAETVHVADYGVRSDRGSDVLLLGDSFTNIYSSPALNWGEHGGLAETLGAMRGIPVDAIIRNDAGAFATRQLLANELKRGRDRLEGKKVVIWEFAIRELANGDWKMIELSLGKKSEASQADTGTVLAKVLKISAVPRPHSAPYKDHVVSMYLELDNGNKVVVYAVSMRDNVWTNAARMKVGDSVTVKLEPWEKREAEYGSWNRSEFDDEELALAEPFFGEVISVK